MNEKTQAQIDERTIRNLRSELARLKQSVPEFDVAQIAEIALDNVLFDTAFVQHSHYFGEEPKVQAPGAPGVKLKNWYHRVEWRVYARHRNSGKLIDRNGPDIHGVLTEVLNEFGLSLPSVIDKALPPACAGEVKL